MATLGGGSRIPFLLASTESRRRVSLLVCGVVAVTWGGRAAAGQAPAPARTVAASPIHGRVVDEQGKPIAGAVVRLYRRESEWSRRDPQVERVQTASDGSFRLAAIPLDAGTPDRPNPARLVLVADHPGHALGWKEIQSGTGSPADIRLTTRTLDRTITVTDAGGQPVPGATVAAFGLGDPSSALPEFQQPLDLKPTAGDIS